ncbi:hypothetical protein DL240490_04865 [Mycobacterium marinum]|nr:hypothetical protein DL240490_04865 [Mycobacterium marinum]
MAGLAAWAGSVAWVVPWAVTVAPVGSVVSARPVVRAGLVLPALRV